MGEQSERYLNEMEKSLNLLVQSDSSRSKEYKVSSITEQAEEGSFSEDEECMVIDCGVSVKNEDDPETREVCDMEDTPSKVSVLASCSASTSTFNPHQIQMLIDAAIEQCDKGDGDADDSETKEDRNWTPSYMNYKLSSEDEVDGSESRSDPDYSKSDGEEVESDDSDYLPKKRKHKSKWSIQKRYSQKIRINQKVHSKLRGRLLQKLTENKPYGYFDIDMSSFDQTTLLSASEQEMVRRNRYLCMKNSKEEDSVALFVKAEKGEEMGKLLNQECTANIEPASKRLMCLSKSVNRIEKNPILDKSSNDISSPGTFSNEEQSETVSGRSSLLVQQLKQKALLKMKERKALSNPAEHSPNPEPLAPGFTLLRSLLTPLNISRDEKKLEVKNTLLKAMLETTSTEGNSQMPVYEDKTLRPRTSCVKGSETLFYTDDENECNDDQEFVNSKDEEELDPGGDFSVYLNNAESDLEDSNGCGEEINPCSKKATLSRCESPISVKMKSEPLSPEPAHDMSEGHSGNISFEHVKFKSENELQEQSGVGFSEDQTKQVLIKEEQTDVPVSEDQTANVVIKEEPVSPKHDFEDKIETSGLDVMNTISSTASKTSESGASCSTMSRNSSTLKTLLCKEGKQITMSDLDVLKSAGTSDQNEIDHSKIAEKLRSEAWEIHPGSSARKSVNKQESCLQENVGAKVFSSSSTEANHTILRTVLQNSPHRENSGNENTTAADRERDQTIGENGNVSTSCSQWLVSIAKSMGTPKAEPPKEKVTLLKSMLTGKYVQNVQVNRTAGVMASSARTGNTEIGSNRSFSRNAVVSPTETVVRNNNSQAKKRHDHLVSSSKKITQGYARMIPAKRLANPSQGNLSTVSNTRYNTKNTHPYQCRLCEKVFKLISPLQEHMSSHFAVRPYGCNLCTHSFMSGQELEEHGTVHGKELSPVLEFKCTVCGKIFDTEAEHKMHQLSHETLVMQCTYHCSQCDRIFATQKLFDLHVKSHSLKQCKICLAHFKSASFLARHMKTHVTRYKCNICQHEFMSKQGFQRHQTNCKDGMCVNTFSCYTATRKGRGYIVAPNNSVHSIVRPSVQR